MNDQARGLEEFDAFICYTSADDAFAKALEAAIENYVIPRDVTDKRKRDSGESVPHGYRASQRLSAFRYVGDMTGTEYFESIEKHLAISKKLIVVCSPHAPHSDLMEDEIRRFNRMKGTFNIVPVLVGPPHLQVGPSTGMTWIPDESSPPALTEILNSPLAADFRGFDAKRHLLGRRPFGEAWHCVLANLLDARREDVERREERRHAKRLLIWTTVSAAVAVGMTVAAGVAITSAHNAKRQAENFRASLYARKSDSVREFYSKAIVAAEAVRAVAEHGESHLLAEQALRDALSNTSGVAIPTKEANVDKILIDQEHHRLIALVGSDDVEVWSLEGFGKPIQPSETLHRGTGVSDIVMTSTPPLLITAEYDHGLNFWDLSSPKPFDLPLMHVPVEFDVIGLYLSPDERWLVASAEHVSADHAITAFQLKGRREPQKMFDLVETLLSLEVYDVAFSPDSNYLAASTSDELVALWNLKSPHPSESMVSLTRTKADKDADWKRWDEENKRYLENLDPIVLHPENLPYPKFEVDALKFTNDSKFLIGGVSTGKLYIWKVSDPIGPTSPVVIEEGTHGIGGLAVPSGNSSAIATMWNAVVVQSILGSAGRRTVSLDNPPLHWTTRPILDPDGTVLAVGGSNGDVYLWNMKSMDSMEAVHAHDGDIRCMAFSRDGQSLFTGGTDGTIRRLEVSYGKTTSNGAYCKSEAAVHDLAISPDGRMLYAAIGPQHGSQGAVFRHALSESADRPPAVQLRGCEFLPEQLVLSGDGRLLVAAGERLTPGNTACLWHVDGTGEVASAVGFGSHHFRTTHVAISPDSRWVVTVGHYGTVDVASAEDSSKSRHFELRAERSEGLSFLGNTATPTSVVFTRDSRAFVLGLDDGTCQVIPVEVSDSTISRRIRLDTYSPGVIADLSNRNMFMVPVQSGELKSLRYWPLEVSASEKSGSTSASFSLASARDDWLAIGGNGGGIVLWRIRGGYLIDSRALTTGYSNSRSDVDFDRRSHWFAARAGKGAIALYDLDAIEESQVPFLLRFRGDRSSVVKFDPQGRWLFSSDGDWRGSILRWPLAKKDLLDLARSSIGRNMSHKEWNQFFPEEPYRKTFDDLPDGQPVVVYGGSP